MTEEKPRSRGALGFTVLRTQEEIKIQPIGEVTPYELLSLAHSVVSQLTLDCISALASSQIEVLQQQQEILRVISRETPDEIPREA